MFILPVYEINILKNAFLIKKPRNSALLVTSCIEIFKVRSSAGRGASLMLLPLRAAGGGVLRVVVLLFVCGCRLYFAWKPSWFLASSFIPYSPFVSKLTSFNSLSVNTSLVFTPFPTNLLVWHFHSFQYADIIILFFVPDIRSWELLNIDSIDDTSEEVS